MPRQSTVVNPAAMASHPYPRAKETPPAYTLCEVCDRSIRTLDWPAHKSSKKHHQAENGAKENQPFPASTAWSDQGTTSKSTADFNGSPGGGGFYSGTSGADETGFASNADFNAGGGKKFSGTCYGCGEEGHSKRDCPKSSGGRGGCFNCGKVGHNKSDCTEPLKTGGRGGGGGRACFNCGIEGHTKAECTESPRGGGGGVGRACYNCGLTGHTKAECTQANSGGGRGGSQCFNCYEFGHRKSECTNERVIKCRNCDAIGHETRECRKPKDWSKVRCNNCAKFGHTVKRCPEPVKESVSWEDVAANDGLLYNSGGWDSAADENTEVWDAPAGGSWADAGSNDQWGHNGANAAW